MIYRLDDRDVTALGTVRDGEFFIVAVCSTVAAHTRIHRIVISLDLLATCVDPVEDPYENSAPTATYLPSLDLRRRLAKRLPMDRIRKIL